MKKLSLIAAICGSIALISCNKESGSASQDTQEKDEKRVALTLNIQARSTKATSDMQDGNVSNVQFFVFRGDEGDDYGYMDTSSGLVSGSSATLQCTPGKRIIYAIVNALDILSVNTLDEMENSLSTLKDNSDGHFVMVGKETATISSGANSTSIAVTRLAAKIIIGSITADFTNAVYQDYASCGKVLLKGIYLINVAEDLTYNFTEPEVQNYLHKGKYNSTDDISALAYDSVNDYSLASEYDTEHFFYCYPNSSTETVTKLVVEVMINGITYYYPIRIENIVSNHLYTISELTLTRPGSNDPDTDFDTYGCTFTVEVSDWEKGNTWTEKI